jgi:hypothetical protein
MPSGQPVVAKTVTRSGSGDRLPAAPVEEAKPPADPNAWALAEPPPFPLQMYERAANYAGPGADTPIPSDGSRPATVPVPRTAATPPTTLPDVETVGWKTPPAAKQATTPFPETPAGLGHAPDYTWLTGTVNYLHAKKVWTVRYAGLDEVDPYGGSVTLIENERTNLERFKPGQMVRVEGQFADREPDGPCPRYRVSSIRPLP